MSSSNLPSRDPAPTILLSLDRSWWHRLGFSRLTYRRALVLAGARVLRLDYDSAAGGGEPAAAARRLLDGVDGLVLSGGGDVDPRLYGAASEIGLDVKPARDRFEIALLAAARERRTPVLGICRGAQLINVSRGGTLRTLRADRILRRRHRRLRGHPVTIEADSLLARVLGVDRLSRVVTYHGQAVAEPGENLRIVGRASDGVVEAIEPVAGAGQSWLLGVQWHPELSPRGRLQRRLFTALVEAARSYRSTRRR
jgi:putative glutamine amidotransferase